MYGFHHRSARAWEDTTSKTLSSSAGRFQWPYLHAPASDRTWGLKNTATESPTSKKTVRSSILQLY